MTAKTEKPTMTKWQARQLQNAHADWIEEQFGGKDRPRRLLFQPDEPGERLETMPTEEYAERMGIELVHVRKVRTAENN